MGTSYSDKVERYTWRHTLHMGTFYSGIKAKKRILIAHSIEVECSMFFFPPFALRFQEPFQTNRNQVLWALVTLCDRRYSRDIQSSTFFHSHDLNEYESFIASWRIQKF